MKPRIRKHYLDDNRQWFVYEHNATSVFPTWEQALAYALSRSRYDLD